MYWVDGKISGYFVERLLIGSLQIGNTQVAESANASACGNFEGCYKQIAAIFFYSLIADAI